MVGHDVLRLPLVFAALIPASFIVAALFVTRRAPFAAASLVTFVTAGLSVVAVSLHAVVLLVDRGCGSRERVEAALASCSSTSSRARCSSSSARSRSSSSAIRGPTSRAERGLDRYARSLLLTLASVTLLVISNHLAVLIAAWFATGIGLHQLLTFYRSAARRSSSRTRSSCSVESRTSASSRRSCSSCTPRSGRCASTS